MYMLSGTHLRCYCLVVVLLTCRDELGNKDVRIISIDSKLTPQDLMIG